MGNWIVRKKIEAKDGVLNIEILSSPDGKLFRYFVNAWTPVEEAEKIYHPDGGYWSCPEMSGLYGRIQDCERDAHSKLSLLCP